ncbi:hypothetical protein F0562_024807 [Nyssa sinensis]|uniref:Uncharacterized protein n=1 Tax=Nyssa sinensis TaxID=561372 RepID=A0A5J5BDV5_9ASTE|nr:hypothetical protein F0562_024807 [Nyssa sinensis]
MTTTKLWVGKCQRSENIILRKSIPSILSNKEYNQTPLKATANQFKSLYLYFQGNIIKLNKSIYLSGLVNTPREGNRCVDWSVNDSATDNLTILDEPPRQDIQASEC